MAVRAVTAEYASQLLKPVLWIGTGVYVLIIGIIIWAGTASSPWWLLFTIMPTALFVIGLAIWVGIWVMAKRLAPEMNKPQRVATKKVVKQVSTVAEQLGTPRFILIFRLVKDVIFPRTTKQTFISELAETPGQLHRSFQELRKLF